MKAPPRRSERLREFSPVGIEARYPAPKAWVHPDRNRSWIGRMLPIISSHKRSLFMAWIATAVSVMLGLGMPLFVRKGINGLVFHDLHAVRVVIIALIGIAVARFAFGFVYRYWMFRSAYAIEYDLRSILYEHFTRMSFAFYDRVQSGQLISRANSDIRSVEMFLAFAPTVAIQLVSFVVALALMLRISPLLTLITVLPLPGVWWFGMKMRRYMFPVSWIVQARMADVATIVDENVTGVRIVKSFAAELSQIRQLARAARRVQWASIQQVDIRAKFSPVLQYLPVFGQVGVLFAAGYLVLHQRLDPGSIVLFNSYLLFLVAPFRILGFLLVLSERARASAFRIYEILDTPPDVVDRPGAVDLVSTRGDVEFRNVSFGYGPERTILDGFSLHMEPGETVALVGRNGSGKSTAARLLMRFYDVNEGAVLVDGRDVRDLTQESLRSHVGLVADDAFLFSDTIRNNIAYARPNAPLDDVIEATRAAGAEEFVLDLPETYDAIIGERGYDLSGGQRQRVSLARVLVKDPPILILDEATSSIDVQTEQEIYGALRRVMEGRTTLIIAHRLSTIGLAERVAYLEDGRIVATGRHEELLRTEARYAAALARMAEEEAARAERTDDEEHEVLPIDLDGSLTAPPLDGDGWAGA